MTDIKLPPLPPLHIVPSVEPVDYPEVAQALMDYARAAVLADRQQRGGDVEAVLRLFLTGDGFIAECDIPHIVAAIRARGKT